MRQLLLFCAFVLLVSCNKAEVYSKFDDGFPDNRWVQTDAKSYDFSISDDSENYDLIFKFSHVYDYQFQSVPLDFEITDPSGKIEKFSIDLKTKDSEGKEIGNCMGDICDLSFKIKENTKLVKGNYKLSVSNSFQGPYLPNVLGVGLDVATAKH